MLHIYIFIPCKVHKMTFYLIRVARNAILMINKSFGKGQVCLMEIKNKTSLRDNRIDQTMDMLTS